MLIVFLILAAVVVSKGILSDPLPFELNIYRSTQTDSTTGCSFISVRQTQRETGRSDVPGYYISERSPVPEFGSDLTPGERLHVFAYDEGLLWSRAQWLCGNDIIPDHVITTKSADKTLSSSLVTSQDVLTSQRDLPIQDDVNFRTDPPLHIQPILVSGPSHNRVDLVFFSDGCTYLSYES